MPEKENTSGLRRCLWQLSVQRLTHFSVMSLHALFPCRISVIQLACNALLVTSAPFTPQALARPASAAILQLKDCSQPSG